MANIDPNKPKSVLSRPDEGQDFDIVERTIESNKYDENENPIIYELFRENESIGIVDCTGIIIDKNIINDNKINEIYNNLHLAVIGILSEHTDVLPGDGLYLNNKFILEIDEKLLSEVKNNSND